jgi:hypothetical protein
MWGQELELCGRPFDHPVCLLLIRARARAGTITPNELGRAGLGKGDKKCYWVFKIRRHLLSHLLSK